MISVLIPSRGRPGMLASSVASLLDTSGNGDVEILIAADPDDPATMEMVMMLRAVRFFAPERWGYAQLHRYYNALAERAKGDWLLLWNDDATMLTQGWAKIIEDAEPDCLVADLQSNLSPEFVCFPAMRRSMYEALGQFSGETPHVDSYIQDIGRALGRVRPVDVHIQHDRPDLVGGRGDATFIEGRSGLRHHDYFSPEFQAVIAADTERVRGAGI